MKARWVPVLLVLMALAIPARAQMAPPSFIGPDGQKKIGQYVWVWHVKRIMSGPQEIEADCPVGYVVLGGGYAETNNFTVKSSAPNGQFNGWVVEAGANTSVPNKVTVYAGCAPANS